MYHINFYAPIHVHFIGIGGISMSGLAEILLDRGFKISGSDSKESELTKSLITKGANVIYGQSNENITKDIDLVVYTAAIHPENPELIAAKSLDISCITRANLLGQIMQNYKTPIAISGTHGKTTTTSMVSEILLKANTDPTLSIGGILPSIAGNIRIGSSELFVTEACEYTNSFLSFYPKISLILNIEEDHLDFFKDIYDIRNSFHCFASLLPKDGTLIINGMTDEVKSIISDLTCNVITYGLDKSYDYYATDITYDEFARPTYTLHHGMNSIKVSLGVTGEHNVLNSLAAYALCNTLSIESDIILNALANFTGTERRFQLKGICNGFTILDDYAHHPTEIIATLNAARNYPHKKIWCIFQPHTFTRTKAFFTEFTNALSLADHIILTDIYAAREKNTLGITSKDLQLEIQKTKIPCEYFASFEEIEKFILKNCQPGDLLITMGAGDVVNIGENLLNQ